MFLFQSKALSTLSPKTATVAVFCDSRRFRLQIGQDSLSRTSIFIHLRDWNCLRIITKNFTSFFSDVYLPFSYSVHIINYCLYWWIKIIKNLVALSPLHSQTILENDYVRFIALTLFFLPAKFYAYLICASIIELQQMTNWDILGGQSIGVTQVTLRGRIIFGRFSPCNNKKLNCCCDSRSYSMQRTTVSNRYKPIHNK